MDFDNSYGTPKTETVENNEVENSFLTPPPPPVHARHPTELPNINDYNSVSRSQSTFPSATPPPVPMRSISHEYIRLASPVPTAQVNSTSPSLHHPMNIRNISHSNHSGGNSGQNHQTSLLNQNLHNQQNVEMGGQIGLQTGLQNGLQNPVSPKNSNLSIQEAASQIISSQAQLRVNNLLHQIEQISDIERFYLYLQLPTNVYQDSRKYQDKNISGNFGSVSPGKQMKNSTNATKPGSSANNQHQLSKHQTIDQDSECILTFQKRNQEKMARQWIQDNLQLCEETSLARKDVYEEYEIYIRKLGSAPLLQSDFGKVMRLIFPEVKSRRLGARGSSKYCYAGLRKRTDPGEPSLPMIGMSKQRREDKEDQDDRDDNDNKQDANDGLKSINLPRPPLFNPTSINGDIAPTKRVKTDYSNRPETPMSRPTLLTNHPINFSRQSITSDEGIFSTNTSPLSLVHSMSNNLSPCVLDIYGRNQVQQCSPILYNPNMNNSNNISKFSTQDAYSSQILNQNTSLYSNATAAPLSTPKPLIKTEPNFLSTNTKVQTIATKQLIPKVHTDSEKQLPIPPRDVLSCVEFLRREGILPSHEPCSAIGGHGDPIKITFGNRTLTVKQGVAQNNLTVYQISSEPATSLQAPYQQYHKSIPIQQQPPQQQATRVGGPQQPLPQQHLRQQQPVQQQPPTPNSSKTITLNNSVNKNQVNNTDDDDDADKTKINNLMNNNTNNNCSQKKMNENNILGDENNIYNHHGSSGQLDSSARLPIMDFDEHDNIRLPSNSETSMNHANFQNNPELELNNQCVNGSFDAFELDKGN